MGAMRKSRLSGYKQDRLIEHIVAGTTVPTASSLCGVNRKTATFYFHRLREIIAFELEAENEAMFGGEIEVDESYFGGKVYTKILPGASSATLMPIIERKVVPESTVYSDGWKGRNVLDVSDFHHFRSNHSELFTDDQTYINGVENF